ncbi:MAG: hypothetical protein PHP85_09385 [Gallionella sp.]|nr:hypothetical protein [Gallionella sp.]
MHTEITEILMWRALAIFLLIASLLGMLLGMLLIFKPHLMKGVNRMANRWVSTRHINQWFDRSISIERWFYRNHRPMGLLIMVGAAYIVVYFSWLFDKVYAVQRLISYMPADQMGGLLDATIIFLLTGALLAFVVGLVVLLRPSLLRSFEKKSNQWISLRRGTSALDVTHGQVDAFVMEHARSTGWLLILASAFLFFTMFWFLA